MQDYGNRTFDEIEIGASAAATRTLTATDVEALALAAAAHTRGLRLMVGCNLGTSLATAPAMLIARLAEIVDLDSPLLLARDREPALVYDHDLIEWPEYRLWG